jgi:hypothetical protein
MRLGILAYTVCVDADRGFVFCTQPFILLIIYVVAKLVAQISGSGELSDHIVLVFTELDV